MVVDRGRSISTTCGLLMRARSFFGVVSRERLEAALNELVDTNELRSVELLNTNGEAVASAGVPIEMPPSERIGRRRVVGRRHRDRGEPGRFGDQCPATGHAQRSGSELRSLETEPRRRQRLARP